MPAPRIPAAPAPTTSARHFPVALRTFAPLSAILAGCSFGKPSPPVGDDPGGKSDHLGDAGVGSLTVAPALSPATHLRPGSHRAIRAAFGADSSVWLGWSFPDVRHGSEIRVDSPAGRRVIEDVLGEFTQESVVQGVYDEDHQVLHFAGPGRGTNSNQRVLLYWTLDVSDPEPQRRLNKTTVTPKNHDPITFGQYSDVQQSDVSVDSEGRGLLAWTTQAGTLSFSRCEKPKACFPPFGLDHLEVIDTLSFAGDVATGVIDGAAAVLACEAPCDRIRRYRRLAKDDWIEEEALDLDQPVDSFRLVQSATRTILITRRVDESRLSRPMTLQIFDWDSGSFAPSAVVEEPSPLGVFGANTALQARLGAQDQLSLLTSGCRQQRRDCHYGDAAAVLREADDYEHRDVELPGGWSAVGLDGGGAPALYSESGPLVHPDSQVTPWPKLADWQTGPVDLSGALAVGPLKWSLPPDLIGVVDEVFALLDVDCALDGEHPGRIRLHCDVRGPEIAGGFGVKFASMDHTVEISDDDGSFTAEDDCDDVGAGGRLGGRLEWKDGEPTVRISTADFCGLGGGDFEPFWIGMD